MGRRPLPGPPRVVKVILNLEITACGSSWVQPHILNKPIKRAELLVESRKGDLFNVTTLGRGRERPREPLKSVFRVLK